MAEHHTPSPVTAAHVLHFGYIIHVFAQIELDMQVATAGILGTDLGTAVILMGDMNYRQKRQTLRHLNSTIGIDGYVSDVRCSQKIGQVAKVYSTG